MPCVKGRFIRDTDAWDKQVGADLLHKPPAGLSKPIRWWPGSVTQVEPSLNAMEDGWLSVVWVFLLLCFYLKGSLTAVLVDHAALQNILNLADAGKVARWCHRLPEYKLEVVHRLGAKHQAADALSRLQTNRLEESPVDDDIPVLAIGRNEPVSPCKK